MLVRIWSIDLTKLKKFVRVIGDMTIKHKYNLGDIVYTSQVNLSFNIKDMTWKFKITSLNLDGGYTITDESGYSDEAKDDELYTSEEEAIEAIRKPYNKALQERDKRAEEEERIAREKIVLPIIEEIKKNNITKEELNKFL